ncbi:MAG: hypothetical protein JKY19_16250 [Alcanivoracaceae bacterium]|nr:hypothetical protein [Alcanivoracaceae bacterium]
MYDYNNGRFLSVDPFIQNPGSTQSLNPYTYIFNNPLSGVDPTGYISCSISDSKESCTDNLDDGDNTITDKDGNELGVLTKNEDGTLTFTVTTVKGFQFANSNGIKLKDINSDVDFKGDIATIGQHLNDNYSAVLARFDGIFTIKRPTAEDNEKLKELYKAYGAGGGVWDCATRSCSGIEKFFAVVGIIPVGKIIDNTVGGVSGAFSFLAKLFKKNPCNCLVADTQVLTENGLQNIQDIQIGDTVWAKDPLTGLSDWKPVTSLFTNIPKPIYSIELQVEGGKVQVIESTDDHPFYVIGKGWVETDNLQNGYQIETKDDANVTVLKVELTDREDVTYNFTVDDFHTYYVTKYGVLVHNINCDISFGNNFNKKVRKHIQQVRNRTNGVIDDIPSPGKGGADVVKNIIKQRVLKGVGYVSKFAGETAQFFPDGNVVYVFRENGEFWTILKNTKD